MFRVSHAFGLGFLSAFQLFPTRGYTPPPPPPSDYEAIRGDWEEVGGFLYSAMDQAPEIIKHHGE